MGFLRRNTLRKEFDEKLIEQLFKQKEEWNRQKSLVEKSLEPSAEVLFELKVAESKYFLFERSEAAEFENEQMEVRGLFSGIFS